MTKYKANQTGKVLVKSGVENVVKGNFYPKEYFISNPELFEKLEEKKVIEPPKPAPKPEPEKEPAKPASNPKPPKPPKLPKPAPKPEPEKEPEPEDQPESNTDIDSE